MRPLPVFSYLWSFLVFFSLVNSISISCRNDKNAAVDWWFGYKMPYNSSISSQYGSGYLLTYLDPSSSSLAMSSISMADPDKGALTYTLNQLYKNTTEVSYILYNDETPDEKESSTKAHAKGVLLLNEEGGIWLVHSTPRFPNYVKDGYQGFPEDENIYGQTFLCMTLAISQFQTISQVLEIDYPLIYDQFVSSQVASAVPAFKTLAGGGRDKTTNTTVTTIKGVGGRVFTLFGKSAYWGKDLYDDLVAPYFKANLYVESWGRPLMASTCKPTYPYDTMNVLSINYQDLIWFSETKDHSKWAVTTTTTPGYWSCVGDINRMESQRTRGGGTVCLNYNVLYKSLYAMIDSAETCSTN